MSEKNSHKAKSFQLSASVSNKVDRQVFVPIIYDGLVFDEGLKLDLLVNELIIIELKAIENVNPVWEAQIISHLRLTKLNLGFLINFNVSLIKQGIRRFRP